MVIISSALIDAGELNIKDMGSMGGMGGGGRNGDPGGGQDGDQSNAPANQKAEQ